MKKIAIAAAVVAIVLLGLPPVLGLATEARVRERVAALDGNGIVSMKVKSFDRGWFGSTARIELAPAPGYLAKIGLGSAAAAAALDRRATITVDFAHGPLVLQKGVQLGWSTMVARLDPETDGLADLQKQLGVPYLVEFRGRTGITGGISFDADVPPMNVSAEPQVEFSGAKLDGRYTRDRLVSNARIDSVEITDAFGTFAMRNLRLHVDHGFLSKDLAPGKAEFSIDRLSATAGLGGGTPLFDSDRVSVIAATAVNATRSLLDVHVTYGVDRVHMDDREVTGAALGIALHNVDVQTLQHYNDALRELLTGPAASDANAAIAALLRADLPRFLAAGPSIVLEPLRFSVNGEPFEGRAEVAVDAARVPKGDLSELTPADVLGFLDVSAEIKLSKALARRFAAYGAALQLRGDPGMPPEQVEYLAEAQAGLMLVELVNEGFLVEDGEVYRAALRYTDAAMTLNDKPLPLLQR
jgi:uncharacterized protein YdgA (DUF945 family)